ncbi:uncharacterized protein LOC127282104 [Leptopilina boulardi]|uniref:uncharacterized protein LOC127282104 n=1 Tax=Leptopilina boulardi TaxID=63433 RepID=UPI0021F59FF8|nr:uncharacterized protein LOC127282104 [Leptopilina boulardi]
MPESITVESIDKTYVGTVKSRIETEISSIHYPHTTVKISALVLPRLTGYVPTFETLDPHWTHLHGLHFADPFPFDKDDVQLIIGADYYGLLLLGEVKKGPVGSPVAQSTLLGWILSGTVNQSNLNYNSIVLSQHCTKLSDLQEELVRFWQLEEFIDKKFLTEEEKMCEKFFRDTHTRNSEGRYIVRLPFKKNALSLLGNSFNSAISMLLKTERNLKRNPDLEREFYNFLKEYEELDHMRPIAVDPSSLNKHPCPVYIPYHPIIKENSSTTRVRLVFNASSPTSSGASLNEQLMVGPKLHNDITSMIIRWRSFKFALTGDICKMFRQILVDERDVDYQRIVCRTEPDGTLQHCQLLTVTYGTACAPYLANRVLKQLAEDEGKNYPDASLILKENIYVDDALFGADTIEETLKVKDDLIELLKKGGFPLRKFNANNLALLKSNQIYGDSDNVSLVDRDTSDKAILGLHWHPECDEFLLSVKIEKCDKWSKRKILSVISRQFDPLGWIAPIIIVTKILMQDIWLKKIDWDDVLPPDILNQWQNYCLNLEGAKRIAIPRWTGQNKKSRYEIHGFADASTKAYAAVVYLRVLNDNEKPIITIMFSKTKVAPLKQITVPTLELCAVALLAKLITKIKTDLRTQNSNIYGWTDSTVVLAWLSKHPSSWRTFVANRVSQVHTLVPEIKWRYVNTKDNPADCASRGLTPSELVNHAIWWHGPKWLQEPDHTWPTIVPLSTTPGETRENTAELLNVISSQNNFLLEHLITDKSSWPKILRITAYCFKFISLCRKKGRVSLEENQYSICINQARKFWCKKLQGQYFSEEIKILSENHSKEVSISRSSPLKSLNPFLDSDGLLRITGRLSNCAYLLECQTSNYIAKGSN